MTSTSIFAGAVAALLIALLLFRLLFDGLAELLGALGWRATNDPGWKLFHADRRPWVALAKFAFGVLAPAALLGLGASVKLQQLLS